MRKGGIYEIFAPNTIGFLAVFQATTNHTGENGDKKQNTLPYTLQIKVVEVCLVGAGRVARKKALITLFRGETSVDICLVRAVTERKAIRTLREKVELFLRR